ncbi:MFS general substrate transporter-like protein [Chaetomium sp. MPI-SDFR-AT-0129]|nr:MFS general substrate transporter-like protein [Chaetomium sp. MPI-SDFR-AT-0129]
MVQPTNAAAHAAAADTSNPPQPKLPPLRRSRASGSFHAGEPFPITSPFDDSLANSSRTRKRSAGDTHYHPLRRQSTAKYHTFPTPPPPAPSDSRRSPRSPRAWYRRIFHPHSGTPDLEDGEESGTIAGGLTSPGFDERERPASRRSHRDQSSDEDEEAPHHTRTPLPWGQLGLLALLSLAEQTALNSIGPYLPTMVASFEDVPDGDEGVYVGLLASAFALAQLATNLLWGYMSDRVGRKPTMLLGTSLLTVCFVFFGLCNTYSQLILVHVAMGLFNGNAAIVPTCLGEVTDRTNQSSAFTWLPVIYSLGSITGPALGGLLVGAVGGARHPFLAPNLVVAALLLSSVAVVGVWFEETLQGSGPNAASEGLGWLQAVRRWCLGRWGAVMGRSDDAAASDLGTEQETLLQRHAADDGDDDGDDSAFHGLRNRNTLSVLGTYLVFQLANISFNSLYPIFASSPPPTGRDLGPGTIGVSLSLAGLVTIFFQVFVFQKLKERMGNLGTYRYSMLGLAISMFLMPWLGYLDGEPAFGLGSGKGWLYGELGIILVLKNTCAVGGLSSVMLLITNSAPSHETLGTLNGIAQTLSAAGRSIGPFLSGGLFTLSTHVTPKGEALAWGLFAGITILGWLSTFLIRNKGLESAGWTGDGVDGEATDQSEYEEEGTER